MLEAGMYKTPGGAIIPVEILLSKFAFEVGRAAMTTVNDNDTHDFSVSDFTSKVINRTGTAGAGFTDTIPDVADLITAMETYGPWPVGSSYEITIRNAGTGQTETIDDSSDTNWTLTGTMTIANNASKTFLVRRTGAATAELVSMGSVSAV